MYKSVGASIEDLAAALLAVQSDRSPGAGAVQDSAAGRKPTTKEGHRGNERYRPIPQYIGPYDIFLQIAGDPG